MTTTNLDVENIAITLDEGDFVGGGLGREYDSKAFNDRCNDLVEAHVRKALRAAYPNATLRIVTEACGRTTVLVSLVEDEEAEDDDNDYARPGAEIARCEAEHAVEDEVRSLIEEIGERVLCGNLAPDPDDFKRVDDEEEGA